MLEGYAEYYSAELSQKVRRGMNETRLKGNYTGGHILYGYKKQDKKLVIDEERAEVVRFIFEQYSIGVYVKDILCELDRRGVTYNGKEFVRSTVYNILKNEKYAGIYRFNGEIIENMFPQIVPTDIFEKVRAKVQKTITASIAYRSYTFSATNSNADIAVSPSMPSAALPKTAKRNTITSVWAESITVAKSPLSAKTFWKNSYSIKSFPN